MTDSADSLPSDHPGYTKLKRSKYLKELRRMRHLAGSGDSLPLHLQEELEQLQKDIDILLEQLKDSGTKPLV